jgi:hypothetical protein
VVSPIIDTSTKFKTPGVEELDMKYVSMRKIRFVVRRHREGNLSNRQIWKLENVSKSSFYRILRKYGDIWPEYKIKYLHKTYRKLGKIPAPISKDVIDAVMEARRVYKVGAVSLERILRQKGISLSHNIINSILTNKNMIRLVKKRGDRKNYVRWERRHPMSLWQTDWTVLVKKWLIVLLDDSSRLIVGYGIFDMQPRRIR